MNICLCFSKNWSHYVVIEVFSLFKNNILHAPIKVYLMSEDLSQNELKEFDNVCDYFGEEFSYEYIDMKHFYNTYMENTLNTDTRFTKYTNFRLAIPYLIPDNKILYIDTDALVCGDISEFYNMDLKGSLMAGAEDIGLQYGHKTSLGFSEKDTYLNAGILLWDLYKIRESKISDTWLNLLKNKHFPAHDQDILFTTISPKFTKVDLKYNVSLSTGLDIDINNIAICHYAGVKDPINWVKDLPFSEIWDKVEKEYNIIFKNYKPKQLIPKKIAYCWFGKNKKPELIEKCIKSWKIHCSDYEVIELNEQNCDINYNDFVSRAYKAKRWAFLNDYFRMKYMYEEGGITLDADVEVIKNLDPFLRHKFFTGQEINYTYLVSATMGSQKEHPVLKMILDYYDNITFDENNLIPNTQFITKIFELFIKRKDKNGKIILTNDVHIYPQEYFCPYDHVNFKEYKTDKTYTIHKFQASWQKG